MKPAAGKKFQLKLLVNKVNYIKFITRSQWCKKSVNPFLYDTGFELENLDMKKFAWIKNVIQALGFNDSINPK